MTSDTRRTSAAPIAALEKRVASLANEDRENVFLYPTGMAAVAAAHRLLKLTSDWDQTPLRNVVFGFPCVHAEVSFAVVSPLSVAPHFREAPS